MLDEEATDEQVHAVVLRTLFSTAPARPWPQEDPLAVSTALTYQDYGPYADFSELHTARRGAVLGRLAEVLGRIATAGEQLGLAWTCEQEALRWLETGEQQPLSRSVAARALAEMTGYYALSAAHGLGNATLRPCSSRPQPPR